MDQANEKRQANERMDGQSQSHLEEEYVTLRYKCNTTQTMTIAISNANCGVLLHRTLNEI